MVLLYLTLLNLGATSVRCVIIDLHISDISFRDFHLHFHSTFPFPVAQLVGRRLVTADIER